jgi:hypothetical protein
MTVVTRTHTHTRTFSVFPIQDKTEGSQFGTIEVIEAESQAALNILIVHDFQDEFKICRRAGNGTYEQKEATSRVMVGSMPKVSF